MIKKKIYLFGANDKPYSNKIIDVFVSQLKDNIAEHYQRITLTTDIHGRLMFDIFAHENISKIKIIVSTYSL